MKAIQTPRVSPIILCAAMAMGLLLTGCIKAKNELRLKADGSGSWEVTATLSPDVVAQEGPLFGMPLTKEAMENSLKLVDGAKLTKWNREATDDGGASLNFQVDFTKIASLTRSDLGRSIGWSFIRKGRELIVCPAVAKDKTNQLTTMDNQQFSIIKNTLMGLRLEQVVHLPNPITKARFMQKKGNSARLLFEVHQNTTKQDLALMAHPSQVSAHCSARGIRFPLPLLPPGVEAPAPEEVIGGGSGTVEGTVMGRKFDLDSAVVSSGILRLRQGESMFPEQEVAILLFLPQGERLDGKTYDIAGHETTLNAPQIRVTQYTRGQEKPQREVFARGYNLKLKFRSAFNNKISGTIKLRLPNQKGAISGSFSARVPRKP